MSSLLIYMAKVLGVRITENNDEMQGLIQEKLKRNPNYCFVFDEVEYLANGNCNKLDVLRQIYDDTGVSIVICGTYDLKDMICGEHKSGKKKTHNRSQLFRRLRLAEFEMVEEYEAYRYLDVLENEYSVIFADNVKDKLVSQCRDRQNGGLGNFIEIIELLFSQVRPEWKAISYQIIKESGRSLHTHTEQSQSFTSIKPSKTKDEDTDFSDSISDSNLPQEQYEYIDVKTLQTVYIDLATYNDSTRYKMLK